MVFRLQNRLQYPKDVKLISIKRIALGRVRGYRLRANAQLMNQYLIDQNKVTLKEACTILIKEKIKINTSMIDNSFVITFIDSDSEKLAKLITFGNREISGCNILKFAFDQKY